MIIRRYLLRELLSTLFGVGMVLLLIFISGQLVSLLNQAADEALPGRTLAQLLMLKNLGNMALLLPLALFFSVMLALGRLYRDNEMAALFACGVGPGRILRTVLGLALLLALAEAGLTLIVAPWAEGRAELIERVVEAKAETRGIAAGRFLEAGGARGVLYAGAVSTDRQLMHEVFIYAPQDLDELVAAAARGYQYIDPASGDRYLMLEDGYRYEGRPGTPAYTVTRFERHAVRLQERAPRLGGLPRDSLPSAQLLQQPTAANLSELHWRIALPVMMLALAAIAVPLSRTSPRQGRFAKFFVGLLVYIVYNNLLNIGRAWLESGTAPSGAGLWWVHALMLGFAGWLFLRQYDWRYVVARWRGMSPGRAG